MLLVSNRLITLEVHTRQERKAAAAAAAAMDANCRALAALLDRAGISHQATGHSGKVRRVVIYYASSDRSKTERFATLVGAVLGCTPPAVGFSSPKVFQVKVAGSKAEALFALLRDFVRPETAEQMDRVAALVRATRSAGTA